MHTTLRTHSFPMLGAFNIPAGTHLRLSPETTRPDRKTPFDPKRQVICASVAEAAPELERRRYGRPPESLYEVLQVKHDASLREIKTAYRTLAKLYHPDVSEGTEGKEFIEIYEAYARLSDPETRAEYDMSLRLSSISRRRPDVRARAGFYTTRRWETDQCW